MATNPTTGVQTTGATQPTSIAASAPAAATKPVTTGGGIKSMATTAQNTNSSAKSGAGSNIAAMRQGWFDKCKELGERKGGGNAAELEMFEDCVERAHPPRSEIMPDDAQEGYNNWRAGVEAKQGFRAKTQTKGTKQKHVSEIKTIISWGALPNAAAPGVFGTVQRVVNATAALRGEMTEHLLKVARTQLKSPDQPLSEAEIKKLLTMEIERPEKTEVEELAVERTRLNKIAEKFGFSNHLRAAIGSLSERIAQLGGTMAERKAAEKAAKAEERRKNKAKKNKAK